MIALRASLAAWISLGCVSPVPAHGSPAVRRCHPPLSYTWVRELDPAAGPDGGRHPACEGVSIETDGREIVLEIDGEEPQRLSMFDLVAFRDTDGIGWFGVDDSGDYWLYTPAHRTPIRVGRRPRDALQSELDQVVVGPNGWWLITWASWVGDHFSLRGPAVEAFFVARATLEPTPVPWPTAPVAFRAVVANGSGLDIATRHGGLPGRFRVRWRVGCEPVVALVDPPPPCASWAHRTPRCLGRC